MKNKIVQNNLISCLVAVVLTAVICIVTYGQYLNANLTLQA